MIFGQQKKIDPVEEAKIWKRQLAKEMRRIDRSILEIQRAEKKSVSDCKAYAKKNNMEFVRTVAKMIVQTRKTIARMYTSKAQLQSVSDELQRSIGLMKVGTIVEKSTAIMKNMSDLLKSADASASMASMAKEMQRAGLIEEMMDDAFAMTEPDDLETLADGEVSKVIEELTSEIFAGAKAAPTHVPRGAAAAAAPQTVDPTAEAQTAEMEADLKEMQAKLGTL